MQLNISRNQTILICCCLYFILLTFYYHIDKYLTGVIFITLTLLIPATFSAIVVYTGYSLMNLVRGRQRLTLESFFSLTTCLIIITYTLLNPRMFNSENLESKVQLMACYEGTQNHATLKLRTDKTFEMNWKGIYFADDWYTGNWERKGNTIYLTYKTEEAAQLGNILLIENGYLRRVGPVMTRFMEIKPIFYLGNCKQEY